MFWRGDRLTIDERQLTLVAEAMLVCQGKEGVAFRVGIASINWDDWLAARPVETRVTLG